MAGFILPGPQARPVVYTRRTLRLGGSTLRTSAVLAPAEVNNKRESRRHHPGASRGLAGVLLSILRVGEPRVQDNAATEQLLQQAAARGLEAAASHDAKQAGKKGGAAGKKAALPPPPPPAIDPFLRPVGVLELRYVRLLSNLCALTYFMDKLSPEGLRRRHGLRLVTSSRACDLAPRQPQMSPLQAIVDGDATAADVSYVMAAAAEEEAPGDEAAAATAAAEAAALAAIAKVEPLVKPSADLVSSSLSAAAAAASTAAGSVASATAPIAAPIASNISAFTAGAASPLASVASQLQSAAAAGQATTAATVATVTAAVLSGRRGPSAAQAQCMSPTEWFVADDEAAGVRHFIIQGSDSIDHWRVNLTFDPVTFEDRALGVKVHRGVYETAQILYDRFLPLVQEAVAAAPGGRVAFAGHSLGGSLATLLAMMYLRRGVVRPENLAPVFTFGAPAIFCEGGAGGCAGGACAAAGPGCGAPGGVLAGLGLPETAVRNVVMHRDIVPRAFACDYSLVADLLRRVGESFREHRCLSGDRRVMFNFVGKVLLLQPDADLRFVGAEGYHPMLPPGPGLFVVREPPVAGPGTHREDHGVSNLAGGGAAAMEAAPLGGRPAAASADEAVWQLMNNPHPLDILGDTGAYGDAGSISRYHNPDNYTRALGGVLRARGAAAQGLVAAAKQRGVTYRPSHLGAPPPRADHAEGAPPPPASPHGGKMHSPPATRPQRHTMPAI